MQSEGIQQCIRECIQLLSEAHISCCVVGELALNYYNVPRVIHGLELCVPAADLAKADAVFSSSPNLFQRANEDQYDLYTEQQKGFPKFYYLPEPLFFVILFSDDYLGLAPVQQNIVPTSDHREGVEYSHELLDVVPWNDIAQIPMPVLGPFVKGQCTSYLESRFPVFAMAVEQLIDGMDLDEKWCKYHITGSASDELEFALQMVAGKMSRIDYFLENTVTCYIPTAEERQRVVKIPGRHIISRQISRRHSV